MIAVTRCQRCLFAAACMTLLILSARAAGSESEANADEARELFVETHRCVRCHSVTAVGLEATSEKMKSKDLSGFKTDDFEALARFIRKEEDRGDVSHKKTFDGTEEELHKILAWLGSVDADAEAEGSVE